MGGGLGMKWVGTPFVNMTLMEPQRPAPPRLLADWPRPPGNRDTLKAKSPTKMAGQSARSSPAE